MKHRTPLRRRMALVKDLLMTTLRSPSSDLIKGKSSEYVTTAESLVLSGLIGIDIVIIQAFIPLGLVDLAVTISLLAFAVAIPPLAISIFLNQFIWGAGYQPRSFIKYNLLKVIGAFATFIGLNATFWYASWILGVVFLVSEAIGSIIAMITLINVFDEAHKDGKNREKTEMNN